MHQKPRIASDIEEYRDQRWRREATRIVQTVADAERFVEQVGFAACLTDSRRPGPSLYVAVCGRRDAVLPRHVQKDEETSLTWTLKDQLIRRGKLYYGKLARGKAMFIAPRMIPHFHAIWGVRAVEERRRLSASARAHQPCTFGHSRPGLRRSMMIIATARAATEPVTDSIRM